MATKKRKKNEDPSNITNDLARLEKEKKEIIQEFVNACQEHSTALTAELRNLLPDLSLKITFGREEISLLPQMKITSGYVELQIRFSPQGTYGCLAKYARGNKENPTWLENCYEVFGLPNSYKPGKTKSILSKAKKIAEHIQEQHNIPLPKGREFQSQHDLMF